MGFIKLIFAHPKTSVTGIAAVATAVDHMMGTKTVDFASLAALFTGLGLILASDAKN